MRNKVNNIALSHCSPPRLLPLCPFLINLGEASKTVKSQKFCNNQGLIREHWLHWFCFWVKKPGDLVMPQLWLSASPQRASMGSQCDWGPLSCLCCLLPRQREVDGEGVYGQVGALSRGSVGNKAVLGALWGSCGSLERRRAVRWEPQCAEELLLLRWAGVTCYLATCKTNPCEIRFP